MVGVTANFGFDDARLGKVKSKQALSLSTELAKTYVKAGLVSYCKSVTPTPSKASGKTSSALPAGRASRAQTVKQSGRGKKKKQATQSLSPTAAS